MTHFTIESAQSDMRAGYLHGAPGVLVSGFIWLVAATVAQFGTDKAAVLTLLAGGAVIHPLAIAVARLLGRSGSHDRDNPLGRLAAEGTFWLLAGCAIAYGVSVLRMEWFFPAMLLAIGGRYLTFQTIYGLRLFWFCGALLCAVGLALALIRAPAATAALGGASIELVFAAILFSRAQRVVV